MGWKRRVAVVTAAVAFGGAGCAGNDEVPETQPIVSRIELKPFATCGELESYIEETAVQDMRTQLLQQKESIDNGGWFAFGGDVRAGGGEAAPQTADSANAGGAATMGGSGGAKSAPTSHSTTNTQVQGVDEADFVKNDGTRIFVLSGQTLYVNQSWPADSLTTVGTLKVEGWPREMFLDEKNRVVIFSQVYLPDPWAEAAAKTAGGDLSGGAAMPADQVCMQDAPCGYYQSPNHTKMTVVDVTTLSAPRVTGEFYLPGGYQSARRIGGSVRLVLGDAFRYPYGVQFYPSYEEGLYEDKARYKAKYDELIAKNEKLIRQASLSQWVPKGTRRVNGKVEDIGYACSDFNRANAPTKLGLVTVATLNLDKPNDNPSRTSIVAESGEVYANADHLYVASRHWWWWPQPGQEDHTYVHKFDIKNADKAVYQGSGGVSGHLLDQFSMDEHNGNLRVATTIATRIADPQNPWGRLETTNRVSVLAEHGNELKVVGKTPDIATGERIFSARFVGDKGFVVTFRQVDPLFTLDLSNPAAPRVVGELKVPGFSTYIHPLDANHLLTIGVHQPENGPWNERTLKLTIFDVTDFANPKEKFTQAVGTAYSWSEALHEHKAFNYFAEKGVLAIPFSDWSYEKTGDDYWSNFTSDLRVFDVSAQTGFSPRGAISMKDVYQTSNDYRWSWYWTPEVRRSVIADDFVYAISDAGIRVAHLNSLSTPLKTVTFQKAQ